MEIRRAEGDDDLLAAIRCYNRAWQVGFRGMVPEAVIESAVRGTDDDAIAAFEDEVSAQPAKLFVAERDGTVVGYLHGRYAGTSEHVATMDAEIVELYVDPAHWREGAATALHEAFLEWLPDQTEGVVVEILAENDRAQAFFEDAGYEFRDTGVIELNGNLHGSGVYRLDATAWRSLMGG